MQPLALAQPWQSEYAEHDVVHFSNEKTVLIDGQLMAAVLDRTHSLVELHQEHFAVESGLETLVHVSHALPTQSSAQEPNFHLAHLNDANKVPSGFPGVQV